MVDNLNRPGKENIKSRRALEQKDDISEDKQLKEKSTELAQGVTDVVEGLDDAEGMSTGEVSEKSSEDKSISSGSSGDASSGATSTSQSKKRNEEPPFEVMVIQLRTQLKKEIAVLQREAKKLQKRSTFSPYHLTQIMQKIRRLREILADLVFAASERIKMLWIEYVKGK